MFSGTVHFARQVHLSGQFLKQTSQCLSWISTNTVNKHFFDSSVTHRSTSRYICSKVRRKEGSGQGWLVKTQVFLFKADKLTQVRTLRHPETSTLSFVSAITLCIRSDCFSLTARAPESSLCLSQRVPTPRWLYWVSPRQLLQSDTGVPHFALDPLTYRCLLSLSPAADFAEPRPPRHIPPPPDSGREALRPAAPPPPFLERKSATVICVPGLWITLNLKGCNARYQRVIRALVSFMRWSHCKGAWSEQRVNSRPRR